jgi:hypothetical protein
MKTYGGADVWNHVILTSAIVGGEGSASRYGRFSAGEMAPGTHWIGGLVGPRTGLDDVERRKILLIPRLELRTLGRSARSQLLYRLRYPGSSNTCVSLIFILVLHSIPVSLVVRCLHYGILIFTRSLPDILYIPCANSLVPFFSQLKIRWM